MAARRPRRQLLLTIYLVGLAQLAVAGTAVYVDKLLEKAPFQLEPTRGKALVEGLAECFDTPAALGRALSKLNDFDLSYYRPDGQLVASTQPPQPPLSAADVERLPHASLISLPQTDPMPIMAVPVIRDGKLVGYGVVHRRVPREARHLGPQPTSDPSLVPSRSKLPFMIACTLIGTALISLVFARSLARPLAQMEAAAQAFGSGDLQARTRVHRNDELGAVAQTFDEMAERVNALLRAQREFLANVSHELRTPLARIRVALDIAAEGDLQSARESLRLIADDWGDLDRLVETVLTVARFDLSQDPNLAAMELRYQTIDARRLGDRAAAAFRSMHKQTLEVASDEQLIEICGDASLLRRVIDNLLNNAGKYSDPDTTIRLEMHRRGDDVEIRVRDRGIGIDAADLPRLFEPFFRTDRSRARKTGGVGLGLALAKRIVEAHHGRITVESQVGAGTTVSFTIPVEPDRGGGAA
ncbi:MAG: periplasmic sensor signal transduction histidine kinase [Myxococcales bacterium]|nr:periplasmic sensor signal transduction histidine kinase [Myxococcales bacterium]